MDIIEGSWESAISPSMGPWYKKNLQELLSQDKSSFYAHVTSRAVWLLTLRKISPCQDSYFGHKILANNVGVNLGATRISDAGKRVSKFTFTYTTKSLG